MAWSGVLLVVTALMAAPAGGPRWCWPLRPDPEVLRAYDPPAHPWEAGHRGVDLAAHPGQAVYAAGPGRVGYARDLAGRGVVTVIHGRSRTTYLPVRATVRPGQTVRAGARVGVVEDGLGHCGPVTCLHWGLRQGLAYLDPLILVGRAPVRLLPWWDVPELSTDGDASTTEGDLPAVSIPEVSTCAPRTCWDDWERTPRSGT
jgi:murein DD-endopeptidase MepM/ murein hydrolase activator NlpD